MADFPPFEPSRLLALLTAHRVDFVLIGGFAAVLHGSPRITRDVDISYADDVDNLRALGRALAELHARPAGVKDDIPFVPDERTLRQVQILTLDTDLGQLDLLAEPNGGPGYVRLRAGAVEFELSGFGIRVAEIDDLLAMKAAAGRPKDLADIAELEAIRRLRAQGVGPLEEG